MKIKLTLHHQNILGFEFSSIYSDNFIITIDENLNLKSSDYKIKKYPKMKYAGPKEFRNFMKLLNIVDDELKGKYFEQPRATISGLN
jgi:hypothetical protein